MHHHVSLVGVLGRLPNTAEEKHSSDHIWPPTLCEHKKNRHSRPVIQHAHSVSIPAFRESYQKWATRKKTFLRSGAASKNDRPEKKHSSVQARPPKMGHQKWFPSVLRRPRKMLHNSQRSRSGINLLRKIRDQKKNIPAFRCGHRKCSTRKNNKEQRHQTCVKKCATKQHIFWRSGVAIEHAKPENSILTFRIGHRKCATRKKKQDKEHATTGRYPKKCATRKKHSSVQRRPSNTPH